MIRKLALLAVGLLFLASTSEAGAAGQVTVVHGVPGLTVDVYVNGTLTLEDFEPRTITDPVELEAGDYEVAITPADAPIEDAVITGTATVADGVFASLVAHLAEDGSPTLSAFEIDLSPSEPGSRVTVAHAAAAPPVDVSLGTFWRELGRLENVSNGESASVDVRQGLYLARIFPAGEEDAVFGPSFLFVRRGYTHVVYAIGSLADENFGLLVQKVRIPPPVPTTADVAVVHGIPGLVVDVYVNGELALDDFEPGTITDPIELEAGDYDLAVLPGEGGDINDPLLEASVTLEAGQNVSVVAYLMENGDPTLGAFLNQLDDIPLFKSRLVVRHTAAAPAVDVELKRWVRTVAEIENLANSEEAQADVYRGFYSALLFPTGEEEPVFGPARLILWGQQVHVVYAVGSLEDDTFGLLVQRISIRDRVSGLARLIRFARTLAGRF